MRLHALTSVVFHLLYCKGQFTPDTLKDLLATPTGTPGRVGSGGAQPVLARQSGRTPPGALPSRTSPGRRSPEPGFDDFPRFSYPESYKDYVYRDLSQTEQKLLFAITVRTYDLVRFYSVPK